MNRQIKIIAVAAVLALAAACSAQPSAETGVESAPSLPSKTTSATRDAGPVANERGFFPKELGDPAGLGSSMDSPESATFTIDSVQIDPPCDQYGIRPASGRTLLLDVRVATGNDAGNANAVAMLLFGGSFVEIGDDGVTHAAQIGMCTDPAGLITNVPTFGTNQKYQGKIEIVVPEASGTLALQAPAGGLNNGGGWEWTYPTN